MKILSLVPRRRSLAYAAFTGTVGRPVLKGLSPLGRGERQDLASMVRAMFRIQGRYVSSISGSRLDMIALRAVYGGKVFKTPTLVNDQVMADLSLITAEAPLEVPPLTVLIAACQHVFSGVPIVLVFETAFFLDLPPCERTYAIPSSKERTAGFQRYGFHGIYHHAACALAEGRLGAESGQAARVLSVCLDLNSEVAAAAAGRAQMVTGGTTPLEGLPGATSCGDLDPGIVLALARAKGWGPEEINECLTMRSGLSGLAGRPVTLADTFSSQLDDELNVAREVFVHRLLLACGAGKAALGGVDALVFSGRHAKLGSLLIPRLVRALSDRETRFGGAPACVCLETSLDRLVADGARSHVSRRVDAVRRFSLVGG